MATAQTLEKAVLMQDGEWEKGLNTHFPVFIC